MRELGAIETGVLFGNDGYLFLVEGAHSPLDLLLGMKKIDEQSFINFEQNILERAAACAKEGVKFLHVISPDKHSVMVEQFPILDPIYIGGRYVEQLPASMNSFSIHNSCSSVPANQPSCGPIRTIPNMATC